METPTMNRAMRFPLRLAVVLAGMIVILWAAGAPAAEPTVRFRDLVFKSYEGDDLAPVSKEIGLGDKKVEFTALEYKVLLVRGPDDKGSWVDPKSYRFKIGDRIRLTMRPLGKSYVYVYHVGASGKGVFLVPKEDEEPRSYQGKETITLPEDGYFEFRLPPGDEKLFVVACAKPVADRAVLAKVITSGDDRSDTPEMKQVRQTLNAVVKEVLTSTVEKEQEVREKTVIYRGLFPAGNERQRFLKDMKARGVRRGSLELPPEKAGEGTLIVSFRTADLPKDAGTGMLVTIPLHSEGQ
jgi:hypothetical protein